MMTGKCRKYGKRLTIPGIKPDRHAAVFLGRRCMTMNKTSRTANSHHQLLFFGVTLLGIILLASALWQPASIEPPGWVAVNNQVEKVLTGQENAKESLTAAAEKQKEKSTVKETNKAASSEQPADRSSKGERGTAQGVFCRPGNCPLMPPVINWISTMRRLSSWMLCRV